MRCAAQSANASSATRTGREPHRLGGDAAALRAGAGVLPRGRDGLGGDLRHRGAVTRAAGGEPGPGRGDPL